MTYTALFSIVFEGQDWWLGHKVPIINPVLDGKDYNYED